jgi:hypothetical protein
VWKWLHDILGFSMTGRGIQRRIGHGGWECAILTKQVILLWLLLLLHGWHVVTLRMELHGIIHFPKKSGRGRGVQKETLRRKIKKLLKRPVGTVHTSSTQACKFLPRPDVYTRCWWARCLSPEKMGYNAHGSYPHY